MNPAGCVQLSSVAASVPYIDDSLFEFGYGDEAAGEWPIDVQVWTVNREAEMERLMAMCRSGDFYGQMAELLDIRGLDHAELKKCFQCVFLPLRIFPH